MKDYTGIQTQEERSYQLEKGWEFSKVRFIRQVELSNVPSYSSWRNKLRLRSDH